MENDNDGNGTNLQTMWTPMDTKKENETKNMSKPEMLQPILEQGKTKTCTGCHKTKTLNHFNKDKKGKYGKGAKCTECRKIENKQRYKDNKNKIKENVKNYYEKNKKEINEKRKESSREYTKKYYNENKEKCIEKTKEWRKKNKKHIKKYDKKYKKTNKEKIKKIKHEWDMKNVEHNKIEQQKRTRRLPERVWATHSLYGHKRNGCEIKITIDELEQIAKNTKNCEYCGHELIYRAKQKNDRKYIPTLDRIDIENEIRLDNIQILCIICNTTKLNRTHKEFIEYYKNLSKKFNDGDNKNATLELATNGDNKNE